MPSGVTNNSCPVYNYENYAENLRMKLRNSYELARKNLIKRKEKNKKTYDEKIQAISLKKNDLVLIKRNKIEGKFEQPYEGPYRVERMITPVIVQIRRGRKSIRLHVNRVIKAQANYTEKTPPKID